MKRTAADVEKDYKRIRDLIDSKKMASIREIAEELNLSQIAVRTSLNHHPIIARKIMDTLKENRKEQRRVNKVESEMKWQNEGEKSKLPEPEESMNHDFVIDVSIMGHSNLEYTVSEILASKSMIIITSVTLRELEVMQMYKDKKGLDARKILAEAVETPSKFKNVVIDETLPTPDDCIVEYCAENREKVTLLTADKTMVLKARMYGVEVEYFKHIPHNTGSNFFKTLKVAKCIDDKLIIDDFNEEKSNIMVISQGLQYTEGSVELKVGDHVYIGWIEELDHSVIFEHYQVYTLMPKDNAVLVYSRKLYNKKGINALPKSVYKNFIKEFFIRHDLF